MTAPKRTRRSFLNVEEPYYALADELRQKIDVYRAEHKLKSMIEALAAMLEETI